MKKHFPLTQKKYTLSNLAQDMYQFIQLQTNLSIGWETEGTYINFLGWYEGVKFDLVISPKDDLSIIQKEVYDYCKSWNKKETSGHREASEHNKLMQSVFAA